MNSSRASEILSRFATLTVLVVGDVMIDEYIFGRVNRVSPEAPVIVVDAERSSQVPGGAANVVNNLCALGAGGIIVGVTGVDPAGTALVDALRAEGADTRGMVTVNDRPTTRKTRIIAHSQQVVRVDHERRATLGDGATKRVIDAVEACAADADAILLSDYQKGVLAPAVVEAAAAVARRAGKTITGNLKPAALAGRAPLDVITLNVHEASIAVGGRSLAGEDEIAAAARDVRSRTGARYVVVTRSEAGVTLVGDGAPIHIPARRVEVYDTAGAGDTVISVLTLALAAGAGIEEAVTLALHAAAEVVKKLGVATAAADEVLSSFSD